MNKSILITSLMALIGLWAGTVEAKPISSFKAGELMAEYRGANTSSARRDAILNELRNAGRDKMANDLAKRFPLKPQQSLEEKLKETKAEERQLEEQIRLQEAQRQQDAARVKREQEEARLRQERQAKEQEERVCKLRLEKEEELRRTEELKKQDKEQRERDERIRRDADLRTRIEKERKEKIEKEQKQKEADDARRKELEAEYRKAQTAEEKARKLKELNELRNAQAAEEARLKEEARKQKEADDAARQKEQERKQAIENAKKKEEEDRKLVEQNRQKLEAAQKDKERRENLKKQAEEALERKKKFKESQEQEKKKADDARLKREADERLEREKEAAKLAEELKKLKEEQDKNTEVARKKAEFRAIHNAIWNAIDAQQTFEGKAKLLHQAITELEKQQSPAWGGKDEDLQLTMVETMEAYEEKTNKIIEDEVGKIVNRSGAVSPKQKIELLELMHANNSRDHYDSDNSRWKNPIYGTLEKAYDEAIAELTPKANIEEAEGSGSDKGKEEERLSKAEQEKQFIEQKVQSILNDYESTEDKLKAIKAAITANQNEHYWLLTWHEDKEHSAATHQNLNKALTEARDKLEELLSSGNESLFEKWKKEIDDIKLANLSLKSQLDALKELLGKVWAGDRAKMVQEEIDKTELRIGDQEARETAETRMNRILAVDDDAARLQAVNDELEKLNTLWTLRTKYHYPTTPQEHAYYHSLGTERNKIWTTLGKSARGFLNPLGEIDLYNPKYFI